MLPSTRCRKLPPAPAGVVEKAGQGRRRRSSAAGGAPAPAPPHAIAEGLSEDDDLPPTRETTQSTMAGSSRAGTPGDMAADDSFEC